MRSPPDYSSVRTSDQREDGRTSREFSGTLSRRITLSHTGKTAVLSE